MTKNLTILKRPRLKSWEEKLKLKPSYIHTAPPPQTTYSILGELEGTHIPGGLGGVTIETDPEKVLEDLRETVKERMTTPMKPNVMTSG